LSLLMSGCVWMRAVGLWCKSIAHVTVEEEGCNVAVAARHEWAAIKCNLCDDASLSTCVEPASVSVLAA